MTDEKFCFISDVAEKKNIGHSATHKRTHCGKGGNVRLPSDYLTRKELNAMSGETKTYRLNSPMTWAEFRAMPDDIKVMYVKAIRDKFSVSDSRIFNMFGISQTTGSKLFCKLGINAGKNHLPKNQDLGGWHEWIGESKPDVEPTCNTEAQEGTHDNTCEESKSSIESGSLNFNGDAKTALKTAALIIGNANVHISISWDRS